MSNKLESTYFLFSEPDEINNHGGVATVIHLSCSLGLSNQFREWNQNLGAICRIKHLSSSENSI